MGLDGERKMKDVLFVFFLMENTREAWKKSNHSHRFMSIHKLFGWSRCLEGKVIFVVCHCPSGRGRGSQCLDSQTGQK